MGALHNGRIVHDRKGMFDGKVGLIAALLYSIYQPWAHFTNLAFKGEMLMNLPIVWA
jgi:hypothetical protein